MSIEIFGHHFGILFHTNLFWNGIGITLIKTLNFSAPSENRQVFAS